MYGTIYGKGESFGEFLAGVGENHDLRSAA